MGGISAGSAPLKVNAPLKVGNPALAVGRRTLRAGHHGAAVKALQALLGQAGFVTAADGSYGSTTARLIRRFQRRARLRVSGVADLATITALIHAGGGSSHGTSSTARLRADDGPAEHLGDRIPLKQGMTGHDVRVLQGYLRRSGFDVDVDGEFGSATVRGVKAFETDQQRTVDGMVDADDIAALRSLVDGDATITPATPTTPAPLTPGNRATVGADGLATAPAGAPIEVQQIIAAGNAIADKPYRYGGGHGRWQDTGYDCSGSVSYALHAAALLDSPLASGDFMTWGAKGPGQWVTLYTKSSHIYMVVAGLRFDTSGRTQDGSRWHASSRPSTGYTVIHPPGL